VWGSWGCCGGGRSARQCPVGPVVGHAWWEAAGHSFARGGRDGVRGAAVDGVNQMGATTPGAAGGRLRGS
jgi:hypothetical protein